MGSFPHAGREYLLLELSERWISENDQIEAVQKKRTA